MVSFLDDHGRPIGDPTLNVRELVDNAVRRQDDLREVENSAIREQLAVRQRSRRHELRASIELVNTRLQAMDKATELRLAAIHGVPDLIASAIEDQHKLTDEKFAGISLQFKERDTRTTQAAETSQKALDAALLAAAALVNQQNEANATAATVQTLSFTKQIDQIIVLTERQQKSSDDRLAELKERIDRGDGSTAGLRVATTDQRASSQLWIAVVGTFLLALSLGVGLAALFLGK